MAQEEQSSAQVIGIDRPRHPLMGATARSLILAIVLTYLASFWINQAEVIGNFCQITEAAPPIPAVGILLVLVLLNPLVRRAAKRFIVAQLANADIPRLEAMAFESRQ